MRTLRVSPPLVIVAAIVSACHGPEANTREEAGLVTVFDSTSSDTVVARTVGEIPPAALRRVVEELRIAPEPDDTALFADVSEIDVGTDGRLYVFDNPARILFIFRADGSLERRVGRLGAGPGEFNSNNGMVVLRDGRLAQWDARNGRISFFTGEGDFLSSWVIPTGFSTNNGLRTDSSGSVLLYRPVTPPREGEILGRFGLVRLREGGAWGDSLIPPDLPVDRVVYVAQVEGNTSATRPAHAPRVLWQWHPDGHFVSVSTSRYVIELSRPGRALRIERDAPSIAVSTDERALEQERITVQLRQTDPGWVFRGPAIPGVKPPVSGLNVARDGRIWVRVATPSVEIPEAEIEPTRAGGPPPRRYRDGVVYEIFGREGRFVGSVTLPIAATWMEADGDHVWYIDRDADGLPAVVRARVEPSLR